MQDTRIQGALVHLVYLEARLADRAENPLREVGLLMIEDACRALLGKSEWPPDRIERLLDQILSGRFGAWVPGVGREPGSRQLCLSGPPPLAQS
jgi:hypothetical protein